MWAGTAGPFHFEPNMCLILLAIEQHPDYPLIIAANRDEYYARPTSTLAWWDAPPEILAGRDMEGGGSWFGLTRDGHLAAVTNYREGGTNLPRSRSRGLLVLDYLAQPDLQWARLLTRNGPNYNGFNLLYGCWNNLKWRSNRQSEGETLQPGTYGLCNHLLDTPWPKVTRGKQMLAVALTKAAPEIEEFFHILEDRQTAPLELLPDTGIGLEWEERLSSIFIHTEHYGTRASTLLLVDRSGEAQMIERSFDVSGQTGEQAFKLRFNQLPSIN